MENKQESNVEKTNGSLLDEIIVLTNTQPSDEEYDETKQGLEVFIAHILENNNDGLKINKDLIDMMISEIDNKLEKQLDELLHNKEFQKLESTWRSLHFLISRTDFNENIKINLLNVTKDELSEDFENSLDITQSGLYKHVYTREYGQFGGEPYGAILGNYEFSGNNDDLFLLKSIANVATVAHAPFIAATSPKMFGLESFSTLPDIKDFQAIIESPKLTKWRDFRENDDARNVGLVLPRFLLRSPYGEDKKIKSFNYQENATTNEEDYLWGNAVFALASNITKSFADSRWCSNIIGPQGGGLVNDLPQHTYKSMGTDELKIPTEILISERKEFELAEHGFISLTMRKGSNNAAFFSANSVQAPKSFGKTQEGLEATSNFKLGTQLPYMFIINRLAHYIKVIQRENIGTWKSRVDLEKELNNWLKEYISDQENPSAAVRQRRPLRNAKISVFDVENDPGWYRVSIQVTPHFKYMGSTFTLSLVSKIENT